MAWRSCRASSTVTTLSFARRSRETPALNTLFAITIILASTVMFPRLLMQIAVVNRALMERMAVANTFMKLLLVLSLGDRGLFKQLLGAVIIIGVAGLASAFLYYDFS